MFKKHVLFFTKCVGVVQIQEGARCLKFYSGTGKKQQQKAG